MGDRADEDGEEMRDDGQKKAADKTAMIDGWLAGQRDRTTHRGSD